MKKVRYETFCYSNGLKILVKNSDYDKNKGYFECNATLKNLKKEVQNQLAYWMNCSPCSIKLTKKELIEYLKGEDYLIEGE